ncbi:MULTISPECIES: tetratricopeptide repeat protein [unclassified Sphingomonas]|uniref:tetratricopeptide repeat protein n=1 Tax=unclassified Sphingomonas TaxID=196159 RepID=UPI00226A49CB|nr:MULTISPECIES: tetratricopeptide repeat protein [unclassified Sphingomonas]
MAEAAYPLLKPRRRARRTGAPRLPRLVGARLVAAGILLLLAAAAVLLAWRSPAAVDPRRALADADQAFARGNYSAARNHALASLKVVPGSAPAHLLLARAYLQLGDGVAAEGELTRAGDAGVPAARLDPYRARARFLQGDYDGAISDAATTPADPVAIRARARALAMQGDGAAAGEALDALLARSPNDGAAWADLGRIRLNAGDLGGAAAAAARAVRLLPGDPVALTLQGEVVRSRFGLTAALPWFRAALQRDAFYHPALIEYAATLGETGRYTQMLAATRDALAARPGRPQALYLQAVLAVRAGHRALARDLLQKAGDTLSDLPAAMLLSGSLDYADGKYEQAIDTWRQLVADQPVNVLARRLLGAALLRSGDAAGALDALRPVAERDDADPYALLLVARAFEASGDRASAATFLDRAAAARVGTAAVFATDDAVGAVLADAADAPSDPNYVVGAIRAQVNGGDISGAIARARSLVAASPGAPAARLALGDALAAASHWADAASAYAAAADLAFDEPTMLRLVDALGRADRPRDAAAALSLYLGQNPQSVPALRLLGDLQLAGGDSAAAIETLESLRRMIGNRDAALLARLARAYAAADESAVARRYARAAYALAPMNPGVADAYGVALAADGDLGAARQLMAEAVALAPADPQIAAHARQIAR